MFARRTLTAALITAATATALAAPAASAATSTSDTPADGVGSGAYAVSESGTCSAKSWYHVSAGMSHDVVAGKHSRITVDAGILKNRAGQTWSWELFHNGERFAAGTAQTAPRGSFTVRRKTADRTGVDRIRLRATSARTGETCSGLVLLPL